MSNIWTPNKSEAQRVTADLGGHWFGRYGQAPCPICQSDKRRDQHALSLSNGQDGKLLLTCHKCHASFIQLCAALNLKATRVRSAPMSWAPGRDDIAKSLAARSIWHETVSINGTPAEAYLRHRGITTDLGASLRYHPKCWHGPSQKQLRALVAWVEQGRTPAIHRTWIQSDGKGKAKIPQSKMMLGSVAGGAVRLLHGGGPLVVAEGIETALSVASGVIAGPMNLWATLSASGMAGLNLPEVAGHLIIAADGDPTGRDAAAKLAQRAWAQGWKVQMMEAPDGLDFNDVLAKEAL